MFYSVLIPCCRYFKRRKLPCVIYLAKFTLANCPENRCSYFSCFCDKNTPLRPLCIYCALNTAETGYYSYFPSLHQRWLIQVLSQLFSGTSSILSAPQHPMLGLCTLFLSLSVNKWPSLIWRLGGEGGPYQCISIPTCWHMSHRPILDVSNGLNSGEWNGWRPSSSCPPSSSTYRVGSHHH